ncbi:MAG TPA: DMT family transporter [Xanthobacteraceae bacterium]|jgi:drug/metabolite transporter (DMT)-like permease
MIIGIVCGTLAALAWAAGFVVAKHGIEIGFSPADLALHRFFWSGLLVLPLIVRDGLRDLGGIGWGRGLVMSILSGPPQSLLAYSGFILVPLGHGTTIQPACAALSGLVLASVVLHEQPTVQRIIGGAIIIAGLLMFGAESLTTIGRSGVGGDLLFASAGLFWATFGTLLRLWNVPGTRAVSAVGTISVLVFAPIYLFLFGLSALERHSLFENLLQAVVQGGLAGSLPIYLFAHAVIALGGGRAATFPALVPVFGVVIGFLALGVVPSLAQFIGMLVVLVGFQFALRR